MLAYIPFIGKVLDKIFPDKTKAAEAKARLMEMAQKGELAELEAAAQIITAEANSEHWLVSAWRPITMLVFVFIVFNNYILAPYIQLFFDTNVALDTPPDLWQLIKIGLGGYVVGRSGEKVAKVLKK